MLWRTSESGPIMLASASGITAAVSVVPAPPSGETVQGILDRVTAIDLGTPATDITQQPSDGFATVAPDGTIRFVSLEFGA